MKTVVPGAKAVPLEMRRDTQVENGFRQKMCQGWAAGGGAREWRVRGGMEVLASTDPL